MQPETRTLLEDIRQAAEHILGFAAGRNARDLETDVLLRSAVERQFEIIGEALNRLVKSDRAVAERITEHRLIIAFRNRLVHGYNDIDYEVVWQATQTSLPDMLSQVNSLIDIAVEGTAPPSQDRA
jgi:uncharacterized protein with HEPN domain